MIILVNFLIYNIRLHIFVCGVLSVATLLSYVVLQYWICIGQDNKTLAHLCTIHGSNSYQDMTQKSLEHNKVG